MRIPFINRVEFGRVREGEYASIPGDPFGAFTLIYNGEALHVIANAANQESEWWEHVSVSTQGRTPTWDEMCWVKDLFWLEEECVVQYHPPRSEYVNCHPNCLHLWRPTRRKIPVPKSILVGPKL
jgi:hypothetical protein